MNLSILLINISFLSYNNSIVEIRLIYSYIIESYNERNFSAEAISTNLLKLTLNLQLCKMSVIS